MPMPDKTTYNLAVVRPVWLPFNKTAKLIVNDLIAELGFVHERIIEGVQKFCCCCHLTTPFLAL